MTNKKPNAELVWKQLEDVLVPRLRLSLIERTVYSHLLRHSRLEGKQRLRFSVIRLAGNIGLTTVPVRKAVRRLAACGALRVVQRSNAGHVVKVCLPDEIPRVRRHRSKRPGDRKQRLTGPLSGLDVARTRGSKIRVKIEEADFLSSKPLRKSLHAREGGQCFYCLRQTTPTVQCLDHVVPQARLGRNTYRNLVSTCMQCNAQKGEKPADDFLRRLYRERRLTARELAARLRALDAVAAGKLRPSL